MITRIWSHNDIMYLVRCEELKRDWNNDRAIIMDHVWTHIDNPSHVTKHIRQQLKYSNQLFFSDHNKSDSDPKEMPILNTKVYQLDYVLEDCIDRPVTNPLLVYDGPANDFPGFKNGKVKGT